MTEFVLYGGKGGVGKTTLAAATALKRAREGERTLVVSTDPAHSLTDVFQTEIAEEPSQVRDIDTLHAMEIDPRERFRSRYGDSFESLLDDVQSYGVDVDQDDVVDIAERGLIPGADEIAVVDLFAEYSDHPDWDVVVFDTAPTGHTLRLLRLPDVMSTTVGKLLSLRQQVDDIASTVTGIFKRGGDDDEEEKSQLDKLSDIDEVMEEVGERLRDEERTTFRAVTLPEEMALAETGRLLDQLDEAEIHVSRVFANKVLLDVDESCDTCWKWHKQQQRLLTEAEDEFSLGIHQVPLVIEDDGWRRVQRVASTLPEDT